jgi:RNA polymerase sigma factor (sigma-70 family)
MIETRLPEQDNNWIEPWIQAHKGAIIKFAKKYVPYSGYNIEDFFAEASLAAVEADIAARQNCKSFNYYFWGFFRNSCRKMTHLHGAKVACWHEPYIENPEDDEVSTITYRDNRNIMEDSFISRIDQKQNLFKIFKEEVADKEIQTALNKMTLLEKEVWTRLLQGDRICEIAKEMGKKRQLIQKLRNSGLKKAQNRQTSAKNSSTRKKEKFFLLK